MSDEQQTLERARSTGETFLRKQYADAALDVTVGGFGSWRVPMGIGFFSSNGSFDFA